VKRVISNDEVVRVLIEPPEGHQHVRTTIVLSDGTELVFQEATMANIVRGFVSVKTHPTRTSVCMDGRSVASRKPGFAEWQLLEESRNP